MIYEFIASIGGSDYEGGEYDAVFAAGETTATVTIPIIDDEEFGEGTENFFGTLSISELAQSYGIRAGDDNQGTVNIEDDDMEPDVEVNFSPTQYRVDEGDGLVTLTLTANSATDTNYTVYVNTNYGTAVGEFTKCNQTIILYC